jgi:hypothetical protein
MIIIIPLISEYSAAGVLGRTRDLLEINFEMYANDGFLDQAQF